MANDVSAWNTGTFNGSLVLIDFGDSSEVKVAEGAG